MKLELWSSQHADLGVVPKSCVAARNGPSSAEHSFDTAVLSRAHDASAPVFVVVLAAGPGVNDAGDALFPARPKLLACQAWSAVSFDWVASRCNIMLDARKDCS